MPGVGGVPGDSGSGDIWQIMRVKVGVLSRIKITKVLKISFQSDRNISCFKQKIDHKFKTPQLKFLLFFCPKPPIFLSNFLQNIEACLGADPVSPVWPPQHRV